MMRRLSRSRGTEDRGAAHLSRGTEDRGAAMLLVLAWSMVLLVLALVVVQAVVRRVIPSDGTERSYAAQAAAEAAIDDYRARLIANPVYYATAHADNAALTGWAAVPGGPSDSSFHYAVDASRAGVGGEIRVYATGRSGTVTRTLEAVLSKRSTLDYVYMSDIETPAPDLPGAYSTAANSGGTGQTARQLAEKVCSRHWYESGQVTPTSTGNQRNLNFCQWAGINTGEKITGKLHTNDVWRLQNTSLTSVLDAGAITSSCRSTADGLQAGEVGCQANRRFIATSGEGLTDNIGNQVSWNNSYEGDAYRPKTGDSTQRNPRYDTVLALPQSPALLKQHASESGCVFTGPTRIRFSVEGGVGYMYVTSPDTKVTSPACGGTGLAGTATAQPTKKIDLSQFTDLAIYVQNVRRSTEADDPDNAYDLNNQWASGAEPTCQRKGTNPYPFVIPTDAVDQANFNSGSTYKGFPSEQANQASPWYSANCSNGDLYVQGTYQGRMTIATEDNIIITSSLVDATADATGKPASSSQSALGLVSDNFTYLYRPFKSDNSTWVGDWKSSNAQDPKLDVAILAVTQCFAAQDPSFGSSNGSIYLWGSLAQKYRCIVGYGGGYGKKYSYDDRLGRITPPYMLELSNEPWKVVRYAEITTATQAVGAKTYSLLLPEETGGTVSRVSVSSGPATVSVVGTTATVTATAAGTIVVTYDVTSSALGTQARRLVIVAGNP